MHVRLGWSPPREQAAVSPLGHPLLERIGRTPLVELRRIPGPGDPRIFRRALELAHQFKPILPEEESKLRTLAAGLNPIFG